MCAFIVFAIPLMIWQHQNTDNTNIYHV